MLGSGDVQTFDFAALLEAMPDAVVVADMQSRIVYANASVERVLGWAPDALIGQHLHAIQPERLHEAHDEGFGRYASTGQRTLFGTPVRLPALSSDGVEHDVELNLAEITGPGGERLVMGVIRDLSERVELEQERAARDEADRSRAHFELLAAVSERLAASLDPEVTVQSVADAVVPTFADWCIVDLLREDRTLDTVAAAHREPSLVERIAELRSTYPPENRTPPHSIYRALEGGRTIRETVSGEDLGRRALDPHHLGMLEELGIGSHMVATLSTGGRVIGAVSLVRRPDRAPFDENDVATAEGIARRAAMATENARLYRSAEQAIEMRDRFLAVASHELRTPLSVVYGHWELLARWLRNDPDAASRPNAGKIETSVQRLGQGVDQLRRLVEELLDVSRLSHGRMDLRRAPVDLASVVRQSVDDASASAATGRLRLELPDGPVIGQWDEARLGQVVDNLLLNALKYSPGDRPVEVTLSRQGERATLRVSDEGIGIPRGELESIFEPFSRAQNASAQHFPGLGLGLAVSREIVTRLGGRMWAESEGEGLGSRFFVELDPGDPSPPEVPTWERSGDPGRRRRAEPGRGHQLGA